MRTPRCSFKQSTRAVLHLFSYISHAGWLTPTIVVTSAATYSDRPDRGWGDAGSTVVGSGVMRVCCETEEEDDMGKFTFRPPVWKICEIVFLISWLVISIVTINNSKQNIQWDWVSSMWARPWLWWTDEVGKSLGILQPSSKIWVFEKDSMGEYYVVIPNWDWYWVWYKIFVNQ